LLIRVDNNSFSGNLISQYITTRVSYKILYTYRQISLQFSTNKEVNACLNFCVIQECKHKNGKKMRLSSKDVYVPTKQSISDKTQ